MFLVPLHWNFGKSSSPLLCILLWPSSSNDEHVSSAGETREALVRIHFDFNRYRECMPLEACVSKDFPLHSVFCELGDGVASVGIVNS